MTWTVVLPAAALVLGACKKKEEITEAARGAVESVDQAVDEVVTGGKARSAEERAAKLGFVAHLSGDTQTLMAIYDGRGIVRELRGLKIWEFARRIATEEAGMDPEEMVAEQGELAGRLFGDEFFIATGKGMTPQMTNLMTVSKRVNYYQMRSMSRALAQAAVSGDMAAMEAAVDDSTWIMDMAKDIGEFMPQIESAQVPPVLAGMKITDSEAMEMAEGQLTQMLAMAAEVGEPLEFEKGGAKFTGHLFKGAMLADEMEKDRGEMDETIGKDQADRIIATMREKDLAVAVGKLGSYLLLYIGGSAEGCPIAESLADSLAVNDRIDFVDALLDRPIHGMLYGDEELMKSMVVGGLGEIAEGLRDGITGVEGIGDTRELVALLDQVGDREQAVLDLITVDTMGGLISLDQGANFDLFGGGNSHALDYEAEHKLAGLGAGENVLIFGNWVANEEYQKRSNELFTLLLESAYAMTGKVAGIESDSAEFTRFKEVYQMFDEKFRKDAVGVWDGLVGAGEALGDEGAIVVDLNAKMPPLPGMPQEIVEGGRFIRGSLVAPVKDRAKLAEAWKSIDVSLRGILKSAQDAGLGELNMLDPTNSEKDDVVTWYFDALAFSDDVKPSVTISDDWFVASTSRTQALDLVAKAGAEVADPVKGAWFEFNLDALRSYVEDAVKLVDENGEVVIPDESALTGFRARLPQIREGLAALEQFDAITIHDRMEAGTKRVTLHFRTR